MNNLSVQVRKACGLSAGKGGCRAGVVSLSSSKTCPLESGHGRLERPLHASQPMSMPSIDARCGDCSALHFMPPRLGRLGIVRCYYESHRLFSVRHTVILEREEDGYVAV